LRYDRTTGVDVAGTALLVRDDGVTAQLTFGMEHAYKSDYRLHGSTGILEVDRAFTPAAQHRPTVRVTRNGDVEEFRLLADDQVAKSISAFADAVRTGEARPAPATEVLRHVAIAEAIHRVAGSC
jgi:NDP-hexose-3-ketoreductase